MTPSTVTARLNGLSPGPMKTRSCAVAADDIVMIPLA
jgi:hypothetical protein